MRTGTLYLPSIGTCLVLTRSVLFPTKMTALVFRSPDCQRSSKISSASFKLSFSVTLNTITTQLMLDRRSDFRHLENTKNFAGAALRGSYPFLPVCFCKNKLALNTFQHYINTALRIAFLKHIFLNSDISYKYHLESPHHLQVLTCAGELSFPHLVLLPPAPGGTQLSDIHQLTHLC